VGELGGVDKTEKMVVFLSGAEQSRAEQSIVLYWASAEGSPGNKGGGGKCGGSFRRDGLDRRA
jgi:hypothetical protein